MTDEHHYRVSLGETAYRRLRADIVSCRLAPGQRLTEKQLAADTGFGTSPLREALTRLDHDGLIRTLPRKGYQVTPLTPKSVDDLFVMWRIVGPELVRLGVTRASADQLDKLRTGFGAIEDSRHEAAGPETAVSLVELADSVFSILARATGNDYLIALFDRISSDMARIYAVILQVDPAAIATDPPDHWVGHILAERDADEAAATAQKFIARFHERVMGIVTRWPSVMSSEVVPSYSADGPRPRLD